MVERTVSLIKTHIFSDFTDAAVPFKILEKYTDRDLRIVRIGMFYMNKRFAKKFYAVHDGKPFFEGLINAMVGNTVAILLEGEGAIQKVRDINGATNPCEAAEGTLRNLYGRMEKGPFNAVHGSDSRENAKTEAFLLFGGVP